METYPPRQRRRGVSMLGWVLAAALLCAGCGRTPAGPQDKRYPLTGVVISVDRAHHHLGVQHDAVAGYMSAMTMDFPVGIGDDASVHPGERIRATLVVDPQGNARLEGVWPDDRAAETEIDNGALALRQDTHQRGNGAYRDIGEGIPDFALYDQDGKVVESGRFRGKQVMLNFIYTNCPIASMCPLATAKMVETQKQARAAGIRDLALVTITLDPVRDTPGVLKAYAAARDIDTSNFTFLTGPEGAIRDLLLQFGVIAEFQDGIFKHTLATLLIDRQGRIAYRADGSEWLPADFVARMRRT